MTDVAGLVTTDVARAEQRRAFQAITHTIPRPTTVEVVVRDAVQTPRERARLGR
ncbi:hypothetical protein ACFOY2_18840 [Nonomuraea purpurea]|uniref:Uncharacterized protein n=1 Tax=Nonomuraea purpurea TaxID=1849276 RepID=A0ABV8G9G1_9ACTN